MTRTIGLLLTAATLGVGVGHAQVSVGVGTTGGSVGYGHKLNENITLRGGYNWFKYDIDETYDDVAYAGDLDLSTFSLIADWHPFANGFMISAGAYIGDKGVDATATPTSNVDIGGGTYTPAQVGSLNMKGDLENVAPFIGLGWETTQQSGLGFRFVAGAMMTGSADVALTSSGGTLSSDPGFQTQLRQEEQNLRDDIDDFELYPVLEAALTWKF